MRCSFGDHLLAQSILEPVKAAITETDDVGILYLSMRFNCVSRTRDSRTSQVSDRSTWTASDYSSGTGRASLTRGA